jgi:putative intracellular protease/amidase
VRGRGPGHGHDRGAAVLGRFRRRPAPDAEAAGDDEAAGRSDATADAELSEAVTSADEAELAYDAELAYEAPASDDADDSGDAVEPAFGAAETGEGEQAGEEDTKRLRIGIVLFDGVEELDWAGPWEVLAAWARFFPDDGARVCTLAPSEAPVTCAKGARVLADHTWDDHPPLDVLLYPGGEGTRRQLGDMALRRWLLDEADQVSVVASVCTGALVLADAGLLDGRPATTHWASLDQLGGLGADIEVRADQRVVDDGDVVTAAGVSAGIDMALHLVGRFAGEERAKQVQKIIEYFPEPPT